MLCNNGLHGALYHDCKGKWTCLLCKEEIDSIELEKKREVARQIKNTDLCYGGLFTVSDCAEGIKYAVEDAALTFIERLLKRVDNFKKRF